jgi:hypothetical protein
MTGSASDADQQRTVGGDVTMRRTIAVAGAALMLVAGCGSVDEDLERNGAASATVTQSPALVVPTSPVPTPSVTAGSDPVGVVAPVDDPVIPSPDLKPGQWIGEQVALDLCRTEIDGRRIQDETAGIGARISAEDPTAIVVCEDWGTGTLRAAAVTDDTPARRLWDRLMQAANGKCPDTLPSLEAGYQAHVVVVDRSGATTRIFVIWTRYGETEVTSVDQGCGPVAVIEDIEAIAQGRGSAVFERSIAPIP